MKYFDSLLNSLEEGIIFCEVIYDNVGDVLNLKILDINKALEKMAGTDKKSIVGKTIKEVYSNVSDKLFDLCKQSISAGKSIKSDFHFQVWEKHFKVNVLNPDEEHVIMFFSDITELIRADEVLKKHFILFENAHDILLYLKSDGSIIDANKTAVDKYGYSYAELLNMKINQLRHPSMLKDYKTQMEISFSRGIVFEGMHVRKDGTCFPVEVSSRSIDVNSELLRIHIIRDITERKQAEKKITYLANYDSLTDISNRGYLMKQLEETMDKARKKNFEFAVMLFDVDKFKYVNDVYGHNAGDEVLRNVALRLKEAAGKSNIVGRLGGDEFLVIQTLANNKEETSILADRIVKNISQPVKWKNNDLDLCISMGVAVYPMDSRNSEGLIHCADKAMYNIKQKGGNSFNFYSKL